MFDPMPSLDRTTLLARLAEISASVTRVDHAEIQSWLTALPESEQFSPIEWDKIVEFAADQRARWIVEWLFSRADSPDSAAEVEADAWSVLWNTYSAALIEHVPSVREAVLKYRDLVTTECAIRRRVDYNNGKTFQRAVNPIVGWLGIQLDRAGLRGVGQYVYRHSLYPPGTVGRSKG